MKTIIFGKPVDFDLAYQVKRHFNEHMARWPKSDPAQVKADITRLLTTGNAWLWPEPKQGELFE